MHDVGIVGGGMAGMAVAARLQARGLSTVVFEAHGQPGGCAGYFRRRGFAFDVGATTLVDFEPGGVGGELLASIGMPVLPGEALPGYRAWLPDRVVTLHRDSTLWAAERLRTVGDTPAHRAFWANLDRLAAVFWDSSRAGIQLPVRSMADVVRAATTIPLRSWPLVRYLNWTMSDLLCRHGLRAARPLCGLLSMLLEDTVHGKLDSAPLINGALGVTIRGAGLTRAVGGMWGFWKRFVAHYRGLGGLLRTGCTVQKIRRCPDRTFVVEASRGQFPVRQIVCTLPAQRAASLAPPEVASALSPYLRRDAGSLGGAMVLFLGVPEHEVTGETFTHHQLLQNYDQPLGLGNNMFVSVSAAGDTESAPPGHRAVMISTHCELEDWQGLDENEYLRRKVFHARQLLGYARRVYPALGQNAVVEEFATPRTYERYTRRPLGAVGGVRQTLSNSNQHAIPYELGIPGFYLAGDSTWPGLGTVAAALSSRLVSQAILRRLYSVRVAPAGEVEHAPAHS